MTPRNRFLSILVLSIIVVVSISTPGISSAVDINRLYDASKPAIVVIINERTENPDEVRKNGWPRQFYFYRGDTTERSSAAHVDYAFVEKNANNVASVFATGTGFIFREDGLVITSYHIVRNSRNLVIETSDGRFFEAEILGFDARPEYDIAVLKIKSDVRLPALKITAGLPNEVYVGKKLLIIGHPYLYKYTASEAAVSRLWFDDAGMKVLQIHSSILPGNSGSPVLNEAGDVVGVIYATISEGDSQGFATPIARVNEVINKVLNSRPR